MLIENLKLHNNLIEDENYQTKLCWAIIQSSKLFSKPLIIDEFLMIIPLNYVNSKLGIAEDDFNTLKPLLDRIKYYEQINGQFGQHIYLMEVKMISLEQERMKVLGTGLHIKDILDDILNILSLYYNRYFNLFPFNIFYNLGISEKFSEAIIKSNINYEEIDESSVNIAKNINIVCKLRQDQFYLIEKSMKLYSNSLYTNETNPSIALCFLISSIEVLAQKYIELSENWDEYSHLGFYRSLSKILKKIENDELNVEIFAEIGQKYLKEAFQVKAKYREFIFQFAAPEFHLIEDSNENLFRELVGEYYDLRSLYTHTGKEILTSNYNKPILYNKTNRGKLRTYNEGSLLDTRILPSFQFLIKLVKSSILNFINYLYENRDNEQDMEKFNLLDNKPRSTIEVTARSDISAGTAVLGSQVHMKEQYIHLYERSEKIKEYDKTKNYKQLINEFTRIKEKIKDSEDYNKIILCYNLLGGYHLEDKDLEAANLNLFKAKKICEDKNLESLIPFVSYNIACYYSLKNELDQASKFLSKAIGNKQLKIEAKIDKHLENLRNDSRFHILFE